MALQQDRADAQHVDGLREQCVRRGRVHPAAQGLKLLDDVSGERVRDRLRRRTEIESRQRVRCILVAGQRPDDVEQLLLGQTHQRPAQQRAEGEPVPLVGEHAGQGDEVLDLLAPVEALASLRGDGDATLLQRLLIAPELAPGRCQQGDVAGPARALTADLRVANLLAADQSRAHVRDGFGLAVPLLRSGRLSILVRHRDVEGGDRRSLVARWLKGSSA